MHESNIKKRTIPLILAIIIILLDQITKSLVVKNIPVGTIYISLFGDFLRIIHVTNLGAAFSIGHGLSALWRFISLCIIPLLVLIAVLIAFFLFKDLSQPQRWFVAGILGGGFGNLIDRFFRPDGVIDFIDVKWFGWKDAWFDFLRWDRWPTFNIADSAVLICEIALIISFIFSTSSKSSRK